MSKNPARVRESAASRDHWRGYFEDLQWDRKQARGAHRSTESLKGVLTGVLRENRSDARSGRNGTGRRQRILYQCTPDPGR